MEGREPSSSKSPSRHKVLRRSLSAQPEEASLSSSPYSTRKRSGLPGRSLTEYFSHKLDRSARAGSDDPQVSQKRTSVVGSSNLLQLVPLPEEPYQLSRGSNFAEAQFDHSPGVQVYTDYERRTVVYSLGNGSDSARPEYTSVCDERLTTGTVNSDDVSHAMSLRKRQKVAVVPSNKSVKKDDSTKFKLLRKIGKIMLLLMTVFLSLVLLVIGISTILVYQEALCDEKRNSNLPLLQLKDKLSDQVVGQEVAVDMIVAALRAFVLSKAEVPLVLWLMGSTGTGKTLTTSIMQSVLSNSTHVEVVLSSLLPLGERSLQIKSEHLFHSLDSCALNLVVIDGWDEESNVPLSILKNLLILNQIHRDNGNSKWRIVYVLSGTRGSEEVNNLFLGLYRKGISRENFQSKDFARLSITVHEAASLSTIAKHYLLVPFLPLDAVTVQMCVKRELLKLKRTDFLLDERKLRNITKEVMSRLDFLPSSFPVFSRSGCKRVQSLLALLLAVPLTPL